MEWLLVIVQSCQVAVNGYRIESVDAYQLKCQHQLIDCVRNNQNITGIASKLVSDCIIKRAKGELK